MTFKNIFLVTLGCLLIAISSTVSNALENDDIPHICEVYPIQCSEEGQFPPPPASISLRDGYQYEKMTGEHPECIVNPHLPWCRDHELLDVIANPIDSDEEYCPIWMEGCEHSLPVKISACIVEGGCTERPKPFPVPEEDSRDLVSDKTSGICDIDPTHPLCQEEGTVPPPSLASISLRDGNQYERMTGEHPECTVNPHLPWCWDQDIIRDLAEASDNDDDSDPVYDPRLEERCRKLFSLTLPVQRGDYQNTNLAAESSCPLCLFNCNCSTTSINA